MMARTSARGSSSVDPCRSIPALLTRASIGPWVAVMAVIASATEASESTSMAETWIGRFSARAVSSSSGDAAGFRMVAWTVCPARLRVSAVARPMPRLVPVTRMEAMVPQ